MALIQVQIRDAVKAKIAAGTYSVLTPVVSTGLIVDQSPEDMTEDEPLVTVVQAGNEFVTNSHREGHARDYAIQVTVQCKIDTQTLSKMDDVTDFVEEVQNLFTYDEADRGVLTLSGGDTCDLAAFEVKIVDMDSLIAGGGIWAQDMLFTFRYWKES